MILTIGKIKSEAGFTLMEILVVLGIIAIVSGFSLAFLSHSNKQYALMSTRGAVVSLLRYTRNIALTEKTSTAVIIDPVKKQMYAVIPRTIATWHFEDYDHGLTTGSLGLNGKVSAGVKLIPDGKYGKAFLFQSGGVVTCEKFSFIPVEDSGFIIEAWIYPQQTDTYFQSIIIEKPKDFFLSLEADLSLLLYGPSILKLMTAPEIIPLDRWSYIRLCYEEDKNKWSLFVNNTMIGETTAKYDLRKKSYGFNISSAFFPFNGKIDEVTIKQFCPTEIHPLEPEDIQVQSEDEIPKTKNGAFKIQFDSLGNSKSAKLIFSSESAGTNFQVEVTSSGWVRLK